MSDDASWAGARMHRSSRFYRFGFVCFHRSRPIAHPKAVAGWNRILLNGFRLFAHPETTIRHVRDVAGRVVVVLGDVFVGSGDQSLDDLLIQIATGAREPLDDLSGRFAIFVFSGQRLTVLHDPLGSQSVFYSPSTDSIIASHAALLAECLESEPSLHLREYIASADYKAKRTRFLPGDLTLFENIVHLLPNNELDVRTGATRRFWPRGPIAPSSFDELLGAWHAYFDRYVRFLSPRYNSVIGLTGGQDSRTVIATLCSLGLKPRMITWAGLPDDEAARIAAIVEHLGFEHQWVPRETRSDSQDFRDVLQASKSAAGFTRGAPVLPAQLSLSAGPQDLFLKGLGGEVMRGIFNSRRRGWLPREAEDMAYALYAANVRHTATPAYERVTREAIRAFFRRGNYLGDLHGADLGDLIYWEQRMGTWTSVQHAEMSVGLKSHSAMNSRRLFELAWGLDDKERFDGTLLDRLMAHYDPVLAKL